MGSLDVGEGWLLDLRGGWLFEMMRLDHRIFWIGDLMERKEPSWTREGMKPSKP